MKFEDIMKMATEDAKLDRTELGIESTKLTDLKVKWLNIWSPERLLLAQMRRAHAKLYLERREYYLGKADPQAYIDEPLPIKILKDTVDFYLAADDKLHASQEKIDLQDEKVKYLDHFIRALHDRGYSIKNALEHLKFVNGVG